MIANEWNELQQYRKTSVALQLVIFLFFYEFLGIKYFAAVEPGFTSRELFSTLKLFYMKITLNKS